MISIQRMAGLFLLVGLLHLSMTPPTLAQEREKLLDVQIPKAEAVPAFLPERKTSPVQGPLQVKTTDREISEKEWYWRLLEGVAMSIAVIHTQQETDGRPLSPGGIR